MAEIVALARCVKNVVNFLWNFFSFVKLIGDAMFRLSFKKIVKDSNS